MKEAGVAQEGAQTIPSATIARIAKPRVLTMATYQPLASNPNWLAITLRGAVSITDAHQSVAANRNRLAITIATSRAYRRRSSVNNSDFGERSSSAASYLSYSDPRHVVLLPYPRTYAVRPASSPSSPAQEDCLHKMELFRLNITTHDGQLCHCSIPSPDSTTAFTSPHEQC